MTINIFMYNYIGDKARWDLHDMSHVCKSMAKSNFTFFFILHVYCYNKSQLFFSINIFIPRQTTTTSNNTFSTIDNVSLNNILVNTRAVVRRKRQFFFYFLCSSIVLFNAGIKILNFKQLVTLQIPIWC